MRGIVAKAAVVVAATSGLVASLLVPLSLERPAALEEALRMPVATRATTVSVFPAPGRPESSPRPLEHSRAPGRSAATRAGFPSSHPGAGRPSLARRDP